MKRLIILPDAEIDIKETVSYYKERTEGLEKEFVKLIDTSCHDIKNNPETFPIVKYDIRKYVVAKFEFCIYFIDRKDALYIIAVFHDKRDPKEWHKRRIKRN